MRRMIWIVMLVSASLLLLACGTGGKVAKERIEGSSLYVKKVEDLKEDFLLGMDVSSVLAEERSGVRYYDFQGQERDLFTILAQNGVNTIRVRVWNDPYDESGKGYGGGNNDIDAAVEIGKRAAAAGMGLIVDFHYSDFWADPSKQMVPKAWKDMEIEEKTEALYEYTRDSLKKLKKTGVKVTMVQVGNETNQFLCGEKTWFNIQYLLNAGAKAVREVYPKALVAVHFANPEREGAYLDYAWHLDYYSVDYDVFASSYYPYWHGTLENLSDTLSEIAETYNKKVMVMETSWAYTPEDSDFSGNTIGEGSAVTKNYPYTVQGQANCVRDVIDAVAHTTGGVGVCYWEGAWISVGTESWEANHEKWERDGSGWASSYAASYDPNDAGKYYGGSAVDNQAFFDPEGHPLESLRVFNLVRYGNDVEPRPDAIGDTRLVVDLNGVIELPETADAVMTDNSREAVPVTWQLTEAEKQKMYEGGPAAYTVIGRAGDLEAKAYISMVEYNFLQNDSFETLDLTGWTVTDLGGADELYVEEKATDSLTGVGHMHFWSAKANSVEFTLEQELRDLRPGAYQYAISIMGGDAGEQEIYAYVKLNGEIAATAPMHITSYGSWDTGRIPDISLGEGDVLVVGIYVKCQGEGSGAWGKIDDAMLNSQG